jgi:hypothetical protein
LDPNETPLADPARQENDVTPEAETVQSDRDVPQEEERQRDEARPPQRERRDERERPRTPPPPARGPSREFRRAAPASVQDAVFEVHRIVEMLSEALEDMESVQQTLELAEREKNADEREIDSLRRSLSQMRRPRESEHHSPRPPSGESDRDRA